MTIGFGSRFFGFGLLVCAALLLPACDDDGGGGKDKRDAGMDAGEEEDGSTEEEDTSPPRDAGRDAARDSAPANDAAENPYTCEPPPMPDGSIGEGEACCEGLGICFAPTADAGASLAFGDCNAAENLRCVPRFALTDAGAPGDGGAGDGGGSLAKCRMKPANSPDGGPDYEGRCIPKCFVSTSTLEQGECADDFLCVPCYSLITGDSTGACNNPGDMPVDDAPDGFEECGESLGYCIPATNVGDGGMNLPQLTCGEDERCAPKERVVEPDACFAHCDSVFGAGACVPMFLIPEASRGFLQPASCSEGELCSPCNNPTTMMPTGACG